MLFFLAGSSAKLQQTRAALNPSQAEVAIASEQIAQEKASGEATLANFKREREALIQQQMEISQRLKSDASELQQIETELTQAIVSAPTDGIIFKLNSDLAPHQTKIKTSIV